MEILNIIFALASIALGCFGWLAPRYTMGVVDLHPGSTPMGPSEIRAASGALFVGMGLGALLLSSPPAYAMLGICWLGAGIGRATSLLLDGQTAKKWAFCAIELGIGVTALLFNL